MDLDSDLDNEWANIILNDRTMNDETFVDIVFLYVKNNELFKINTISSTLNDSKTYSLKHLKNIVNNNKVLQNMLFKPQHILRFNIDITEEELMHTNSELFRGNINLFKDRFLNVERNLSDISFSDTLSIFSHLNSIFIVMNYKCKSKNKTRKTDLVKRTKTLKKL